MKCGFVPHRKHDPDCGPRFLPGGLHSPDTGPQSPKLQGLCPGCAKGQFAASDTTLFMVVAASSFLTRARVSFLCVDSILRVLCLWRNGRDGGVATGGPSHPASDTWTQSQFQLEGDANTRLKAVPLGYLSFGGPEPLETKLFIIKWLYCYTVKSSPTTKKSGFHLRHHAKKRN